MIWFGFSLSFLWYKKFKTKKIQNQFIIRFSLLFSFYIIESESQIYFRFSSFAFGFNAFWLKIFVGFNLYAIQ